MGHSEFDSLPVAAYGTVLFLAAIAYYILAHALVGLHGKDSHLAQALGKDVKGKVSVLAYAVAIPFAFVAPLVSCGLYVVVALIWLIPDRRIETVLRDHKT
jgi:uncharacterized membrane protein